MGGEGGGYLQMIMDLIQHWDLHLSFSLLPSLCRCLDGLLTITLSCHCVYYQEYHIHLTCGRGGTFFSSIVEESSVWLITGILFRIVLSNFIRILLTTLSRTLVRTSLMDTCEYLSILPHCCSYNCIFQNSGDCPLHVGSHIASFYHTSVIPWQFSTPYPYKWTYRKSF